jgi:2-dehydro-3-deoxygluconokinase
LSDVFGLQFDGNDSLERTKKAILEASSLFDVDELAFTIREHRSASDNRLQGVSLSRGHIQVSKPYEIQIEDRFGTGDAFAAAYLHAVSKEWSNDKAIEFATAAFALKHTQKGDPHTSTEHEVLATMHGDLSGHVIR